MIRNPEKANQLFADAVEMVRRQRLRPALMCLLDALQYDPLHREALASAARLSQTLGDPQLASRLERLSKNPDDPGSHYELGYYLIDAGRPDIATAFLRQCIDFAPDKVLLRHELGYALFAARRYKDAIPWLREAWSSPDMSPTEGVESGLLLVECLVYALDLQAAATLLDEIVASFPLSEDQRRQSDALARLLDRARSLDADGEPGLRDWHFVQHGGVLLRLVASHETRGAAGGRCLEARPGYAFVAAVLKLGASLLEDLDLVPARVFAASDASVPLASTVAQLLCRPVEPYDPTDAVDEGRDGLLIVRTPEELGAPYQRLAKHREGLLLFAFCIDWRLDSPVLPDMVGIMARHLTLPWETSYQVDRDGEGEIRVDEAEALPNLMAVTGDLVAAATAVNVEEERRQLNRYYARRRASLVLGNPDAHTERPRFSAHSPIETSSVIFP